MDESNLYNPRESTKNCLEQMELNELYVCIYMGFLCGSVGKESTCSMGDLDSISGLGTSPGEGIGYPLQCSSLENSINCKVHGVAKSSTRLSDFHFTSLHIYMTHKFMKRSVFFRASLVAQLVKNPPAM